MRSRREVIAHVGTKKPFEMTLVEDDDVIETLATDGTDETLDVGRLSRRSWSNELFRDTEAVQSALESFTINGIAVAQQITGSGVEGEGFDDLLRSPLGGWVSSDIEVDDLASLMLDNKEHIKDSKGYRGHGEEIDRSEAPDVIVEKRPPGLRWRLAVANQILRYRRLGDVNAQHLQLAVNSRCTPANVIARHAPNELTDFL